MIKMNLLAAAVALGFSSLASAATVQNHDLRQNEWIIIDLMQTNAADMVINPISVDGSFSFTYAFSDTGCGAGASQYNTWSCMPKNLPTNTVMANYNHNFAEGWFDKANFSSISAPFSVSYVMQGAERLFMYFRVTSGRGSIAQAPVEPAPPAPVPLPATAALLPIGLGVLALLKRRRTRA